MVSSLVNGLCFPGFYAQDFSKKKRISIPKELQKITLIPRATRAKISSFPASSTRGNSAIRETRADVLSPDFSVPSFTLEILEAWDDEYGGIVIDPLSLPSSANAFASALKASLSIWKLKGKRGLWLKLFEKQAELVPIAIQEGFIYHHAEPGYVMLTYWIPDEPRLLPDGPSHQIGIGGFVINDKREVLVVKEKSTCSCSGVWKLPTGYINKSEDLFSGAVREVKEETGVDTIFLEMVAFRHVHQVAFDKSDLLFVCMLKPVSEKITIDDSEIQAAKWMPFEEVISQPCYQEDHMSKRVMDICIAAYEKRYHGFIAHQLTSKLDNGKLSFLYYDGLAKIEDNMEFSSFEELEVADQFKSTLLQESKINALQHFVRMKSYIKENDYKSWQVIEDGDDEVKIKSGLILTNADKKKIEKNHKAKSLLLTFIALSKFYLISSLTSAKEIWDELCKTHEGRETIKDTKINTLLQQYELFRFKVDEKVIDAFNLFTVIANELATLGEVISKPDLVRKMLRILPRSWDANRTAIEEAQNLNT